MTQEQQIWLENQDKPLEDTSLDMILPIKALTGLAAKFSKPINTIAQLATKRNLEDTTLYNELLKIGSENAKAKQLGRNITKDLFNQQGLAKYMYIKEAADNAARKHTKLAKELGEKYNETYKRDCRLP